jgi:nitrate/TMAO reductase-like tetraheme cytochrome c subunit
VILFTSGVFALLVLISASVMYTSRPSFCTTCHYMEPFYDSWLASAHTEVTCTQCHFPPGLQGKIRGKLAGLEQVVSYVGRSYTRRKPWAEIEDVSCLQSGCHDKADLNETERYEKVVFNHTPHLDSLDSGLDLRCTSCHAQVVQGEHFLVSESTCFLCHMKKEESSYIVEAIVAREDPPTCTTCHDFNALSEEETKDLRYEHTRVLEQKQECTTCHNKTIIGDGYVPEENCSSCHFESELLNQYDDTELMHKAHISDRKIECTECHLTIQHKIQRITEEIEIDCSTCHSDTHSEQLSLLTGRDRDGTVGTPNPMIEAGLNCASCHLSHQQLIGTAEVRTANPESCESCHGKGYGRLLRLWEKSAETKLAEFRNEINRVRRTVRSMQPTGALDVQDEITQATYALHLIEVGKAVHNMRFADDLIRNGYEKLNGALEKVGADYRISNGETETLIPSECVNCHSGGEVVSTSFEGESFEHEVHVLEHDVTCNQCHSNASEHGQLTVTQEDCSSCHHDPDRNEIVDNCASCHETEAAFYSGTYLDRDEPDYMFDEDVICEDCHMVDDQMVLPQPSVCVDCHDEDYDDMAIEWMDDVQELIDEIRALLEQSPPDVRNSEDYLLATRVLEDLGSTAANVYHNNELTMDLLREIRKSLKLAISSGVDAPYGADRTGMRLTCES